MTTFGFIGDSDSSGEWFASTIKYQGSGTQARGFAGQLDSSGEWFSADQNYVSNWILAGGGTITLVYLPVPTSIIEVPMPILQCDRGAHPRPFDGDDVIYHPGNIVTVYYNDIHDRPGPDTSLINAFNSSAGAFVFMTGGTLPSQMQGIFQVTAYGADKPYHDTQDTHNWFQFECSGAPQGTYAQYGSATYQQVLHVFRPGAPVALHDGYMGMSFMKNVFVMCRDIWGNTIGTPYSGQLFPPDGGPGSKGQSSPF